MMRMKFMYSLYHFLWSAAGAFLYGFPSKKLHVIGITGTKGKSTTIALLAHILSYAGKKVSYISSSHIHMCDRVEKNHTGNSMPGRFYLQRFLRRSCRKECDYALIEVTSQGIMQHRHRFILWDKAVFLDIHPEHIESHGSFQKYLRAKVSFFTYVARSSGAKRPKFFAHAHDEYAHAFEDAVKPNPMEFFSDQEIRVKKFDIPETLPGDFNLINIAAASRVAQAEGISEEVIRKAVASFPGLLGRMTIVAKRPVYAVVDYAHTPDSLQAVYQFLRSRLGSKSAKLICVLGACGGGRDRWKRPVMGGVAARYCSIIILANEDPYDEKPEKILKEIRKGIENERAFSGDVYEIPDRLLALQKAVSLAQEGDTIVCTGKGSESAIHVERGKTIPWAESELLFVELQRQGKYQRQA